MSARAGALLLLGLVLACSCDRRPRATGGSAPSGTGVASGKTSAQPGPLSTSSVAEATRPEAKSEHQQPALPYGALSSSWKLGEVQDLGPAGPMTASDAGVVFVTLDDRVLVARRREQSFDALGEPPEVFAKYGRGPGLSRTHAYWIAPRGELRRAPLGRNSAGSSVASARSGTRVSVQTVLGRDVVAYVAGPDEHPRAFVWADGNEPLALSEDASTALSVELVAGSPHPRALVLEGGLGLSPLHQRTVRVTKRHLNLGPDEVVWVGPGAQPLTELSALGLADGRAAVFLAVSRDITRFGLAYFPLEDGGALRGEPDWRLYPNGIDPAPVVAEHLCGGDYVFYVLPTEAMPRSPQELRVARRGSTGQLEHEEILVRSRAFNDISVAAAGGGAVLSWTADRRTWGAFISCP